MFLTKTRARCIIISLQRKKKNHAGEVWFMLFSGDFAEKRMTTDNQRTREKVKMGWSWLYTNSVTASVAWPSLFSVKPVSQWAQCQPQSCIKIWSWALGLEQRFWTMGVFLIQRSCLPPYTFMQRCFNQYFSHSKNLLIDRIYMWNWKHWPRLILLGPNRKLRFIRATWHLAATTQKPMVVHLSAKLIRFSVSEGCGSSRC